jgi:hypothetical protein
MNKQSILQESNMSPENRDDEKITIVVVGLNGTRSANRVAIY